MFGVYETTPTVSVGTITGLFSGRRWCPQLQEYWTTQSLIYLLDQNAIKGIEGRAQLGPSFSLINDCHVALHKHWFIAELIWEQPTFLSLVGVVAKNVDFSCPERKNEIYKHMIFSCSIIRNLSDDIFEPFLSIGKDIEVDKNLLQSREETSYSLTLHGLKCRSNYQRAWLPTYWSKRLYKTTTTKHDFCYQEVHRHLLVVERSFSG